MRPYEQAGPRSLDTQAAAIYNVPMTETAMAGVPSMEYIREAFLYQHHFARKTMVFKFDFPVTETDGFPYLMKDIALLAKMGIRVVIVPGAGEYIDRLLSEQRIVTPFEQGERLTRAGAMPYVEMAAFHTATRFVTALSASRVDSLIGNFVRARGRGVVHGIDYEYSGMVDKIHVNAIARVLDACMIPILPCIGWSPAGRAYNISSNDIARAACKALKAIKLVIVSAGCPFFKTGNGGISPDAHDALRSVARNEQGRILRMSPRQAQELLRAREEAAPDGLPPHDNTAAALRLALAALNTGVERVHIVDALEEGVILRELFSNMGAGTMIHAGKYESIRPVLNQDIPDMLRLMEPLMKTGILLRRTAEDIQQKKEDYVVFSVDGAIHACAALHHWGEQQAEIAALACDPAYSRMGAGRSLVSYLVEKAAGANCKRVFVLTTSTQDWFEQLGFHEAPVESLPALKRERYDKKRASKIFALDI